MTDEYQDVLRLARLAEAEGFDSVWLSEHHGAADSSRTPGSAPTAARRRRCLKGAWHQLGTYIAWESSDTPEVPCALPPLDSALVDERTPRGSREQVLERLGPWIQAFGRWRLTAVYRLHYPGMMFEQAAPAVSLLATQVAPALRRLAR